MYHFKAAEYFKLYCNILKNCRKQIVTVHKDFGIQAHVWEINNICNLSCEICDGGPSDPELYSLFCLEKYQRNIVQEKNTSEESSSVTKYVSSNKSKNWRFFE